MLARMAAHAAPGSAVMFNSGPKHGVSIGKFEGEPLFHASLSPDAYAALLDAEGFDLLATGDADPDCGGRTVWLFARRTA